MRIQDGLLAAEAELAERGIKSDCKKGSDQCLAGFHHEAVRLLNGHTLVLAGLERIFPAGTQGSKEPVDILGDADPERYAKALEIAAQDPIAMACWSS